MAKKKTVAKRMVTLRELSKQTLSDIEVLKNQYSEKTDSKAVLAAVSHNSYLHQKIEELEDELRAMQGKLYDYQSACTHFQRAMFIFTKEENGIEQ